MQVGFVVVHRATDTEVQISAPDNNDHSSLVTYSRAGDSFALLIGYLYYRQDILVELASRCPHDLLSACQGNNAALALATYRHLGMASLERLEGDFALVIWDADLAQLIGLRDPLGGYPLFWTRHEDTIAFSTSIRPLYSIRPGCQLNEEYMAEFVMQQAPRHESANEQCIYTGLQRVLPGSIVVARTADDQVERRVYWDWLKQIKDPGTGDVVEIAEQYRELLRTAIKERMRGCSTLAHLSGGMDSTSVALLARDIVRAGMGHAPIHTASLVYERLPLLAQERPYIESALQDETALAAHRLLADDLLDFDSFADPPLHDEPFTVLAHIAPDRPLVSLASRVGALTILTGHGADEIHLLLPYYLADWLRHRHFAKAWKEATRRAKASNNSPWNILSHFGLMPITSAWVAGTRWAHSSLNQDADWSIPPWILPDFARRHALRDRAIENARQIYQLCPQTNLSVTLSSILSRAGDMSRWSIAAPLGIMIAHPFLDTRLLSFGLGMQSRILPEPGNLKPVLTEAMRGILPDTIRHRRRTGHFNEVYYLGLARNLPRLEALVRLAPFEGMIDKDIMVRHLQEGSLAGVPARRLQHLNYMLALLKWLCMQKEWLHVRNNVTVTHRV